VQLLVNTRDNFVRPYVYDDTPRWVARLWRRDIRAGHWSPLSHPQVVAAAVTELAQYLAGAPASRALLRAEVGRPRKSFGDSLVVVTGAGSGIGRETAKAFAVEGAEVVVSDIDQVAAAETAAQPRSTACSMNRSLAAPKSVKSGYASIGNTKFRCETLAERCRLRKISSCAANSGLARNASVISSWL
jgi:hypothetical protein